MDADINMLDSMDQSSDERPPVPPRHASKGFSHDENTMNVSGQVAIPRSTSPERSHDSGSQEWREHFMKEKESWELREGLLRSRIEELEALSCNSLTFDAFQELKNDLEAERGFRQQAQDDLRQKSIEMEEIRKRWKQAARELGKCRSQSQGFYQITDNYLIELTIQLRYNIRSFAIQYFEGELRKAPKLEKTEYWKTYMEFTTRGAISCETYLLSQGKCPSIIQAFLWRFLVGQIFDNFRWAGDAGEPFWKLCKFLRPSE
jgi:hypothetical protein